MYFLILKKIDEITKKGYRGRKKWRDKKKKLLLIHMLQNILKKIIYL
jgi:hypothetical protein